MLTRGMHTFVGRLNNSSLTLYICLRVHFCVCSCVCVCVCVCKLFVSVVIAGRL